MTSIRGEMGPLEAQVMEALWGHGPATARQIRAVLDNTALAYTTVATVLNNLCSKGWALRDRDGRAWRYVAAVTRAEADGGRLQAALRRAHSPNDALLHFVAHLSEQDAAVLRQLLAADDPLGAGP